MKISRYSIRECENEKIINRGGKRVVWEEEIFDVVHRAHVEKTGHGGRDVMENELKEEFGISRYENFLNLKSLS